MKYFRFTLPLLLFLCLGLGGAEARAGDTGNKVKEGAKSAWQDFKKAAKDTGEAFKDGAVEAGDKGKEAYDGTKKAVKDVVKGETEKKDP